MTVKLKLAQCLYCTRHNFPTAADPEHQTCTAFPKGIPDPIWHNQADHRKPYAGDQGLQFEAIEGLYSPLED